MNPGISGQRKFDLHFLNAFYAQGVQCMGYKLRTLLRSDEFLMAVLRDVDRAIAITALTSEWLEVHAPVVEREIKATLVAANGRLTAASAIQSYFNGEFAPLNG